MWKITSYFSHMTLCRAYLWKQWQRRRRETGYLFCLASNLLTKLRGDASHPVWHWATSFTAVLKPVEIVPGLLSGMVSGTICPEDGFEVAVKYESIRRIQKRHLWGDVANTCTVTDSGETYCIDGKPLRYLCDARALLSPHKFGQ